MVKRRKTKQVVGFPTLETLKRKIPKGGLLAPSLRKGFGKVPKSSEKI